MRYRDETYPRCQLQILQIRRRIIAASSYHATGVLMTFPSRSRSSLRVHVSSRRTHNDTTCYYYYCHLRAITRRCTRRTMIMNHFRTSVNIPYTLGYGATGEIRSLDFRNDACAARRTESRTVRRVKRLRFDYTRACDFYRAVVVRNICCYIVVIFFFF